MMVLVKIVVSGKMRALADFEQDQLAVEVTELEGKANRPKPF
jgi:hypothetical protein